jgi:hypothetical protein
VRGRKREQPFKLRNWPGALPTHNALFFFNLFSSSSELLELYKKYRIYIKKILTRYQPENHDSIFSILKLIDAFYTVYLNETIWFLFFLTSKSFSLFKIE